MLRSFLFLLFIAIQTARAGDEPKLVALSGKIMDADTQQPVEARVKYRLLPVGHTTGIRNFANEDGSYQLPLQPHRMYHLEVTANQYQTLHIDVQTDSNARLPQDLLLRRVPQPGELVNLSQPLLFDRGKIIPDVKTQQLLNELTSLLETYPSMKVRLEGHTDQGSARRLMRLSGERAEAVKDYLVDTGISRRRIKTKAFGNTHLVSREDTPEARRQNRRVEIRVIEL